MEPNPCLGLNSLDRVPIILEYDKGLLFCVSVMKAPDLVPGFSFVRRAEVAGLSIFLLPLVPFTLLFSVGHLPRPQIVLFPDIVPSLYTASEYVVISTNPHSIPRQRFSRAL